MRAVVERVIEDLPARRFELHAPPALTDLARESDAHPGLEAVGQILQPPPPGPHPTGLVGDHRFGRDPPFAQPHEFAGLDPSDHRRLLVEQQVADLAHVAEVLVPQRQVPEQVKDVVDPERLEAGAGLVGDAAQRAHRSRELVGDLAARRARVAARARRGPRLRFGLVRLVVLEGRHPASGCAPFVRARSVRSTSWCQAARSTSFSAA